MKRAKDYVRDDGPGRSTVTSLAYWLTPEGLTNPIVAALLRDALESSTDDDFAEAFDGATKVEAAEFLAAYELCAMPFWGVDELAQAIHQADGGRDETQAKRAVFLAQKAGELPEVFRPREGVEWGMRRGYLFGAHADFLGAARGSYGHPHAPLASADPSLGVSVPGDGPASVKQLLRSPVRTETAAQRQERRYRMCIDAGLQMPSDDYAHLPRGVRALAAREGITRQAFAEDVKAHIRRSNGK